MSTSVQRKLELAAKLFRLLEQTACDAAELMRAVSWEEPHKPPLQTKLAPPKATRRRRNPDTGELE